MVKNHRFISVQANALWLLLERAGTLALVLAFTAWVARQLGTATFGQWAWLAALIYLGNVFTTFGTDTLLIRNLAQTRAYSQITAALVWQLTLTSVWWLVICLALIFISAELRWPLILASLALWPLAFYSVFSAVLRAHQQMLRFMFASLGMALFQLILAERWVRAGDGVLKVAAIAALAPLVGAGLAALFLRGVAPLKSFFIPTTYSEVWALAHSAWPFAALTGCAVLYQRLSVLLLAPLAGEAATGLFSAAARLADGLKLGHYAVLGALLPALAQNPRRSKNAVWFLLVLACGLAISVSTLAPTLIQVLFGPRFAPSGPVLAVLAWLIVPYTVTAYLSVTYVARGAEQAALWVNVTGVALLALALWVVIPRMGLLGAAWAVVLMEALQATLFIIVSLRGGAVASFLRRGCAK
ncbi:MAG: oligosaccharide flippase family protein [Anaerolineales bacterium]|nr:oligosaccharide flippase family protein [Anaerolineales bacterium]